MSQLHSRQECTLLIVSKACSIQGEAPKCHTVFDSLLTEDRLEKYSSKVLLPHCTSHNMRQLDSYPHSVLLSLSHLLFLFISLQLHFLAQEHVTARRNA